MKNSALSQTGLIGLGMVLGLVVGWLFPTWGTVLEPLSAIFIRLAKTIVIPIVFATLVVGIVRHQELSSMGRMVLKTFVYFELVTILALFIGLAVVNIIQPGKGMEIKASASATVEAVHPQTWKDIVINIVPCNIVDSAARGDVLEVVVFTILFALALRMVPPDKARPILELCESLAETMFKYTGIVMRYAPIGVGAAIAATVGSRGLSILLNLWLLIASLYLALAVFLLAVLLPVLLLCRLPFRKFLKAVREPAIIAFSTSSSEAALPKAMEMMEAFGVPRRIVSFVIPTGYVFNLDGTTLYLSLAAVFVAQAAGMDLTWTQQLMIGFTLILTSKGVAGVPRASLLVLTGTLTAFGLPLEGVAIILGVDAIMDMVRTMVNVIGNCLAAAVIAKWERALET